MKPFDRPLVLLGVAALTLWAGATDAIYRFLRPTMRPWLLLSGVVLVAIGVAGLALARRADHDHEHAGWVDGRPPGEDGSESEVDVVDAGDAHAAHGSRVGWFLLLPLAVAVLVDPGALGAYAASRQSSIRYIAASNFDLEQHLRSQSFGGQVPSLTMTQFAVAARREEEKVLLGQQSVRLTGFVVHEAGGPPGSFLLARLQIGCCAGDAIAGVADLRGHEGAPFDEEQWLEVVGTFDLEVTEAESEAAGVPVAPILQIESLRPIDPPREPYEYP